MESITFLAEIPTGLLADAYSRKLSTVIGVILTDLGFVIEGSFPTFLFVLLAQIIWGIGFTFISGAREAWITDEIGEKKANKAFLHAEQYAQFGAIIGIIISVSLASINLRLPIILGGALYSIWGICLAFLMKEAHYRPTPKAERSSWKHFMQTFFKAIQLVRGHHVLLIIIAISCIFGMFSEGFDRLWTPYILQFSLPAIGLNQNVPATMRATVFSIGNQANALGQILLGPITGLIATIYSLRIAMLGAGLLLTPIIFLYLFTIHKHKLIPL